MKIQLLIFVFIFSQQVFSDYGPIQRSILTKDYKTLLAQTFHIIKETSSKELIRSQLDFIDHYTSELHRSEEYTAKVLPMNDGSGLPSGHLCSSYDSYDYYLTQDGNKQTFTLNDKTIRYQSRNRTLNKDAVTVFGAAAHVIYPPKSRRYFYILLREVEKTHQNVILKQTINLFRVQRNPQKKSCKLAQMGITQDDQEYRLLVTYAKLVAPHQSCDHHLISF
jgi:hypothetical protein